jgi:hypothetical protein
MERDYTDERAWGEPEMLRDYIAAQLRAYLAARFRAWLRRALGCATPRPLHWRA